MNTKPEAMHSKKQWIWPKSHSQVKLSNWRRSGVTTSCPRNKLSLQLHTKSTPVQARKQLKQQYLPGSGRLHLTSCPTNLVKYPGHTCARLLNSKQKLNSLHKPKNYSMKLSVSTKHLKCKLITKNTIMLTNSLPGTYPSQK